MAVMTGHSRDKTRLRRRAWGLAALFWVLAAACSWADETRLQLTPGRCITLHQGQVCSQTIKVAYSLASPQTVCLWDAASRSRVGCASAAQLGNFTLAFKSAEKRLYQLRSQSDDRLLAEAWVEVAWVYKSNSHKQSQWRLF